MCKEEERKSSLVQEELQPLQKEEQQEELQRPEEAAGSSLTLQAVKHEDDENRDTEPLASTSTEHMKTEAYIDYWIPSSPPASDDQLLPSNGAKVIVKTWAVETLSKTYFIYSMSAHIPKTYFPGLPVCVCVRVCV